MVRRSPCETYIKFLISHPDRNQSLAIKDVVRRQQLDCPSTDYVERLRKEMRVPEDFRPHDKLHRPSFSFIMKHKLLGFYHPDPDARVAHQLLQNARAKEAIETSVLVGDTDAFIARRLATLDIPVTLKAVKFYKLFYWDISLVDETEIRALLTMRMDYLAFPDAGVDGSFTVTSDHRLQHEALKRAKYKDPRLLAMSMTSSPMSGILNQLRLGLLPNKVEISRLAQATRTAALVRSFESVIAGGPTGGADSRDYALTMKMMSELITEIGDPDVDLQKQLNQLAVRTSTARVPQLKELGGEFTTDMGPAVVEGRPVKEGQ